MVCVPERGPARRSPGSSFPASQEKNAFSNYIAHIGVYEEDINILVAPFFFVLEFGN